MFLYMMELLIAAGIIVLIYTQGIIPFLKGTAYFPILRKGAKLQKELEEVRQESSDLDMKVKIEGIRSENKKREDALTKSYLSKKVKS